MITDTSLGEYCCEDCTHTQYDVLLLIVIPADILLWYVGLAAYRNTGWNIIMVC